MGQVYVGTSGFAYSSWKPVFYPPKLPSAKFLSHYATRLNIVEINYTFRRLVSSATLDKWIAETPEGFLFAPKAHMRITHLLKLREAGDFTRTFLNTLEPLARAKRLGPVLFQLDARFKCDPSLLADFLGELLPACRYTFEFRNPGWFADPVYEVLRKHNAALCLAENEDLATPQVITADFAYLRLRKTVYSPEERAAIADRVRRLRDQGDVYAIFKHEDEPRGPEYATELMSAIV
jgi:uncharacterized protein YecE (DUF72 family)